MAQSELRLLSEKVLHVRANPKLLAYSPVIDLVAVGVRDENVHVFRLNGQPVQHIVRKGESQRIDHVSWKPDGELFITASSEGIDMYSVEGFKVVHSFADITVQEEVIVTCLAWSWNSIVDIASTEDIDPGRSIRNGCLEELDDVSILDLPRDLANLDVEASLPKLSILPFGSTDGLFDSKESLDSLFKDNMVRGSDVVDVLIIGTDDGRLRLHIFDTFAIGNFTVPSLPGHSGAISNVVLHAAHRDYSSHALVVQSGRKLSFTALDLRFVCTHDQDIALLASKATLLQNMFRYIDQVQKSMIAHFESSQELPSRFLNSVDEVLNKNNRPSILPALYHTVVTGHTLPEVREWLVDELRERGHSRWDKAVSSGFSAIVALVHENMLPALERYSVILSRFMGIAKFHGTSTTYGFSAQNIRRLMELVECIKLVCNKILSYAINELDLFTSFSAWLRHEIDRLSSTNSTDSDEYADKEAAMDHSKILKYIEVSIKGTMIGPFLQAGAEGQVPSLERVSEQLHDHDMEMSSSVNSMCQLSVLCQNLNDCAQSMFLQIAEAEKRNVLFGQYVELEPNMQGTINVMRLVPVDRLHCSAFIVSATKGDHMLNFVKIHLEIVDGVSSVQFRHNAICDLGDGSIVDIAFLDDHDLLILWKANGTTPRILRINYEAGSGLVYHEQNSLLRGKVSAVINTKHSYKLPGTESFEPGTLAVREMNDSKKGIKSIRICVMNQSGSAYKVYTLP